MKLTVSQRVLHEKYGLGVISEADPKYTLIEFDEHGPKKFLTTIVSLQPSDEPPPKRRRARKKAATAADGSTTVKKKATKKAAKKTVKKTAAKKKT